MNFKWQSIYIFLSLCVTVIFISSIKPEDYFYFFSSLDKSDKSAYKGFPLSQIKLGDEYYNRKQYDKAFFWYNKALKHNNFDSYNILVDRYIKNNEVFKGNIYKIITQYQKWSKAGDIIAQKQLLNLSCYNLIEKTNYIKSLYNKWENVAYMMFDCMLYKNNFTIGKDNKKIIDFLKKLKTTNKNQFLYEFLSKVHNSNESEKNQYKQVFKKAISNNYPPALLLYGYMYFHGYSRFDMINFPENKKEQKKEATKWLSKFANTKWKSIQTYLTIGSMFGNNYIMNRELLMNGEFLVSRSDFKEALKWYKKAYSLSDDTEVTYWIGMLYFSEGKNITKYYKKAFNWFYKSASKNYMPAQIKLGDMYLNGWGIQKSEMKAIKWYKLASKHNSFFCSFCYKTDLILNKVEFTTFLKNIKKIYRL